MAKLKKFNLEGTETGQVDLSDTIADADVNGQLVKDYIVAIRANQRQWSACTRDRSEVNHSTKKPHRQKGLGRARQGSLAAPQYKGGGVVFGPRPKFNQHVRINQKERRQALRALMGEKVRESRVIVVEEPKIDAPKTKPFAAFFKAAGITGRVLFLNGHDAESGKLVGQSLSNIPKTHYTRVSNVSGYDLMRCGHIVLTESALEELNSQVKS